MAQILFLSSILGFSAIANAQSNLNYSLSVTKTTADCLEHSSAYYCLVAMDEINGTENDPVCNQIRDSCISEQDQGGYVCQTIWGACYDAGLIDTLPPTNSSYQGGAVKEDHRSSNKKSLPGVITPKSDEGGGATTNAI